MRRNLLLLLGFLFYIVGLAQVTVYASIDSSEIYIGEQVTLNLKVTAANDDSIIFPKLLVKGLEVLTEDTTLVERINAGKQQSVTKKYTITSFDSAFYYIPPLKVKIGDKEYLSKSLALKVLTPEIDTLHLERFMGPKKNVEVPYSWKDWKGIFMMSVFLLLLLLFLGYVMIQWYNNKPIIKRFRLRVLPPPHIWAIKEIEKLRVGEVKREKVKEYYSELTDVLRIYIQRRYGFNAKEMTSKEIIDNLMASADRESIEELKTLFYTADLAKFARLQTLLSEDDSNLLKAVNFVNATKLEERDNIVGSKKAIEFPQKIKRTTREQLLLKVTIAIVLIISVSVLWEMSKSIYNLLY